MIRWARRRALRQVIVSNLKTRNIDKSDQKKEGKIRRVWRERSEERRKREDTHLFKYDRETESNLTHEYHA